MLEDIGQGLIFPLSRAARPDMRLVIDTAHPEAAALSRAEWPPQCWTSRRRDKRGDPLSRTLADAWIELAQAPIPQTAQESLLWSLPAEEALPTPRPLV